MAKSRKYMKKGRKTRCSRKHRLGKKCNFCSRKMSGGSCNSCLKMQAGGQFYKNAAPMPGPFVGKSWNTNVTGWPGVNGVGNDRNYLPYNNYHNDPVSYLRLRGGSTPAPTAPATLPVAATAAAATAPTNLADALSSAAKMLQSSPVAAAAPVAAAPAPPAVPPAKGGKKLRSRSRKSKSRRRKRGGLNLIPQDLVNLGRDISFNLGSSYNALNGYPAPANPLPYKDQLVNTNSNAMRALLV